MNYKLTIKRTKYITLKDVVGNSYLEPLLIIYNVPQIFSSESEIENYISTLSCPKDYDTTTRFEATIQE